MCFEGEQRTIKRDLLTRSWFAQPEVPAPKKDFWERSPVLGAQNSAGGSLVPRVFQAIKSKMAEKAWGKVVRTGNNGRGWEGD